MNRESVASDYKTYVSDKIQKAISLQELIADVKPLCTTKNKLMIELSAKIKESKSVDDKKLYGQILSELKLIFNTEFEKKKAELNEMSAKIKIQDLMFFSNLGLEGKEFYSEHGSVHPLSKVKSEAIKIFRFMGFNVHEGPEIETEMNNFEHLCMGESHPARGMHDTFYLDVNRILRTHTTCIDIRNVRKGAIPIKSIAIGKTYRCDSDRTHSPVFHQLEMLAVDKELNMGNLKFIMLTFLRRFFDVDDLDIRVRSSYFPFTEPSAEVDIAYKVSPDGSMQPCSESDAEGYLEVAGCGMLRMHQIVESIKQEDPYSKVLDSIDAKEYAGAAFGMGIERLASIKYGIKDIRECFKSNYVWLKKNSFDFL